MSSETELTALSSGADLWIVPERKKSRWVQKLDWYLNFQIAKSLKHRPRELSDKVQYLLKACALENYDFLPDSTDSLLVLSTRNLPNRWILVLKGSDELQPWVQAAVDKWKKMNFPSLRIFLPDGVSKEEIKKLWKKAGGGEDLSLIEEASYGK
jgi:hypothetical protein